MTRSQVMARIKKKDTKPELVVRRLLTELGYRYRLHRSDLPGNPDIAFIGRKRAIFCHGCFWHQHGCANTRTPKSNLDYWTPKLARNIARDKAARELLRQMGWKSLIVWECERKSPALSRKLERFIGQ
jgi:DNA mismatch endonuclease, patch repair protein